MANTNRHKRRLAREKKRKARALLTVTTDEAVPGRDITIAVSALESLGIDPRYQGSETRRWVYQLAEVLANGGQQIERIVIAIRPDESRWIVDGQQRWRAHMLAGVPIKARTYHVATFEAEQKLFLLLNDRKAKPATTKVMAHPGEGALLIQHLNTSDQSALRGDISTEAGVRAKCPASTVARWLVALFTGLRPSSVHDIMSVLNEAIETDKASTYKRAEMLAVILAKVFHGSKIPSLAPRAIALVCRGRWDGATVTDAFAMPNARQTGKLQRVNWTEYGNSNSRLPILLLETEQAWPAKWPRTNSPSP